jgi:hypothetical protein
MDKVQKASDSEHSSLFEWWREGEGNITTKFESFSTFTTPYTWRYSRRNRKFHYYKTRPSVLSSACPAGIYSDPIFERTPNLVTTTNFFPQKKFASIPHLRSAS